MAATGGESHPAGREVLGRATQPLSTQSQAGREQKEEISQPHSTPALQFPDIASHWPNHTGHKRAREPADTAHVGPLPESNRRWRRIKRLERGIQTPRAESTISCLLVLSLRQSCKVDFIIHILYKRKLRFREV